MNDKLEKVIRNLQKKGYRDSRLKRKIIELILNSSKPISIPEIIEKLETQKERFNKSSLYREIKKLLSEEIIIVIDLLDGKKRYELNNDVHHHHALCTKCGNVICVDIPNNLEVVEKQLLENKGFKVTGHVLEFFGVCKDCMTNTTKP